MLKFVCSLGAAFAIVIALAAPSFGAPARGPGFAGDLAVPLNKSHIVESDVPFKRISIGNSEIADILPLTNHSFYVLGKKLGVTNITLFGPGERVITVFDVTVTYDITGLKLRLSELFPSDAVEVRATADGIVLSGAVAGAERLNQIAKLAASYAPGKVTNLMSATGSQQVLLAVRFVEVNRQVGRALGLKTNVTGDSFSFNSFSLPTIAEALATTFGIGTGTLTSGSLTIDFLLDALESKGALKSLAEPNLVALSGDTASFLAGGEFPIPVAQTSTTDKTAITVEFKQFGVSLAFTPTVLDEKRINLIVKPEVSTIDNTTSPVRISGFDIPGLKTSRVETTIELQDGQSFAIAGLFQDNYSDTVSQLPWIGDVPVLGALFRSSSFQSKQSELAVIVTAYLVKPALMAQLSSPDEHFIPPGDVDLFLGGRTEGGGVPLFESEAAGNIIRTSESQGGLAGAHGYILE